MTFRLTASTGLALASLATGCGSDVRLTGEGGAGSATSGATVTAATGAQSGPGTSATDAATAVAATATSTADSSSAADVGGGSPASGGGSPGAGGGLPGVGGNDDVGGGGVGAGAPGTGGTGGTGGSGGSEPSCPVEDPSPERIAACNALGEAFCGYFGECISVFLPTSFDGDVDRCAATYAIGCIERQNVDETAYLTCIDALAEQYSQTACFGMYPLPYPSACAPYGLRADGDGCLYSTDCAGGGCSIEKFEDCGVCVSLGSDGASCERDDDCLLSRTCIAGTCGVRVADGEPCDSDDDCLTGDCTAGLCAPRVLAHEGDACEDVYCDPAEELYCDEDLLVCLANPLPAPGLLGEDCVEHRISYFGGHFDILMCEPGTTCIAGTCAPVALPGEACPADGECVYSTCDDDVCTRAPPAGGCYCD